MYTDIIQQYYTTGKEELNLLFGQLLNQHVNVLHLIIFFIPWGGGGQNV